MPAADGHLVGISGVGRRLPLLAVLVAAAYRLLALLGARAVYTPDTFDYVRQSRLPLDSAAFWTSQHPPLLPLLWKPLPGLATSLDPVRIGDLAPALVLNGVVASAAWGFLALTVARGRVLVAAAVLAVSLAAPVTGWESAGLSESISLSLLAAALAFALRYARRPGRWEAAGLGILLLLATLARDTNLPLLVLAIAPVLLVVRRNVALVASFAVAAAALSLWGQQAGHRSVIPTRNALGAALTHRSDAAWLHAHGLPEGRDQAAWLLVRPARHGALGTWVDAHGRNLWLRYLASHPRRTFELGNRLGLVYDPPRTELSTYWGGSATGLDPRGPWLAVLALFAVGVAVRRRRSNDTLVLLGFAAATLPTAFLIWDADAVEFLRHAMALPVMFRVVAVTLAALGAQAVVDRCRSALRAGRVVPRGRAGALRRRNRDAPAAAPAAP